MKIGQQYGVIPQHSKERPELGCAKCGACAPVCPVFRAEGRESLTARGRMHLLLNNLGKHSSALYADLFSRCLLCGACEQTCPRNLPVRELIVQARRRFPLLHGPNSLRKNAARSLLSRPALLEALVKTGSSLRRIYSLPVDSGLRLRLALLEDRPANPDPPVAEQDKTSDLSYFVGCFARHLQPSIAEATHRLLRRCGLTASVPSGQNCCGLAAWSAGSLEQARALARKNIQAFAAAGPILTSCASCSAQLLHYPNLFAKDDPWREKALAFASRVQEFSVFFSAKLAPANSGNRVRVFYHDPCHLRFRQEGKMLPRRLLKQQGFTVLEPENGPLCCGQGGLFHIACPDTSAKIFMKSCEQALSGQPDCITSTCSGCLMQYQLGFARLKKNVRAVHTAVLITEGREKYS